MEKHNNAVEAYCQDKICCCQHIKHCFNFMFRWQIARRAPCKRVAKGRRVGGREVQILFPAQILKQFMYRVL